MRAIVRQIPTNASKQAERMLRAISDLTTTIEEKTHAWSEHHHQEPPAHGRTRLVVPLRPSAATRARRAHSGQGLQPPRRSRRRRSVCVPVREVLSTLPPPETCDEWFDCYDAYQRECGQTDPTKRTRWKKWISPRIGKKIPDAVTRADVEDIRDALDAAVIAWKLEGASDGRIAGKTATNVWSALTSSFKAMASSKRRDLRVLNGKPNPYPTKKGTAFQRCLGAGEGI